MSEVVYEGWKFISVFKAGTPDEWQMTCYVGISDEAVARMAVDANMHGADRIEAEGMTQQQVDEMILVGGEVRCE